MAEEEGNLFFNTQFETGLFDEETDRNASKQEKQELLDFIGGFEKWTELDEDCKMYIIGLLNYWTRCNLSLCSKNDNRIVKETILFITNGILPQNDGIRLRPRNLAALCKSDFDQENGETATVDIILLRENSIEMRTISNFSRSWKVTQKGDDCVVLSKSGLKTQFVYSNFYTIPNRDSEEEYVKIVNKVIKNNASTVKKLIVFTKWNINRKISTKFECLKVLELRFHTTEDIRFWVDLLNPDVPLDKFEFFWKYWYELPVEPYPFEAIQHPSIISAKDFNVRLRLTISEEQLFSLKCPRVKFTCNILSFDTLYEVIRRWVDNELGYEFEKFLIWTYVNYKPRFEKLLEDFDAIEYQYRSHTIPHYQEFFVHFQKYYTTSANFYQIKRRNDPYCSISVLISYDFFLVLRTGFPSNRMGQPYMKLVFPNTEL